MELKRLQGRELNTLSFGYEPNDLPFVLLAICQSGAAAGKLHPDPLIGNQRSYS